MVAVVKNAVCTTISTILSRPFAQLWPMVPSTMHVCAVYDAVPHAVPGKPLVRTPTSRVDGRSRSQKKIESIILEPNRINLMTSLLYDAFNRLPATCGGAASRAHMCHALCARVCVCLGIPWGNSGLFSIIQLNFTGRRAPAHGEGAAFQAGPP